MSAVDLEARLRAVGAARYHHRHPFNQRMHAGTLSPDEIRCWVRNRYYYQTRIPLKDGLILAKAADPAFRRGWIRRIRDHDGEDEKSGGLALWLALAEAVGLPKESVARLERVLPGVRRACDAYVEFVAGHDLLAAVASSLTELFAGDLMGARIAAFEAHYPWVETAGLDYFRARTRQAPADAEEGLAFVLSRAKSPEEQDRCVWALERKCEILWSLLDAVEAAHARPRLAEASLLREATGDEPATVVLPERAVKLNPGAREILSLCDGRRSCEEIAEALAGRHPGLEGIRDDTHEFLERMVRLGVLRAGSGAP